MRLLNYLLLKYLLKDHVQIFRLQLNNSCEESVWAHGSSWGCKDTIDILGAGVFVHNLHPLFCSLS